MSDNVTPIRPGTPVPPARAVDMLTAAGKEQIRANIDAAMNRFEKAGKDDAPKKGHAKRPPRQTRTGSNKFDFEGTVMSTDITQQRLEQQAQRIWEALAIIDLAREASYDKGAARLAGMSLVNALALAQRLLQQAGEAIVAIADETTA